jgi:hypothetical protein
MHANCEQTCEGAAASINGWVHFAGRGELCPEHARAEIAERGLPSSDWFDQLTDEERRSW